MTAATSPRRHRPLLIVLVAPTVLLGAVGLRAVSSSGPRCGLSLTPPSPERCAQIALEDLDQAYHAERPEREAAREEIVASEDAGEAATGIGEGEIGGLNPGAAPSADGPLVLLLSEDLDATVSAVEEAGGVVVAGPYEFPGGRRFGFTDPSGNCLGVFADS